ANFFHSIELVTMVVVGGMASVFGSVLGAVLLTALRQALATFEGWEVVVFGAILMLCMIFLPRGLVPTLAARLRLEDCRHGPARSRPHLQPVRRCPGRPARQVRRGRRH